MSIAWQHFTPWTLLAGMALFEVLERRTLPAPA